MSTLPTLEMIAGQMNVSPRTVIRRLRAMNTTYQQVCDDVLKQRARELLANPANSLQDVAARLGYADAAGFRKAFKRWYGVAPGEYRQRFL